MAWEKAQTVAFTRLDIVARVPSAPGVFGIMDGQQCLLVGESWNLKARLLDLANLLDGERQLSILYETCSEEACESLKAEVVLKLGQSPGDDQPAEQVLPGLSLRETLPHSA